MTSVAVALRPPVAKEQAVCGAKE